jgi:hypothetical protein
MARTVRTKVYKFNELSEQAKEKVIDNLWDINVDYDWYELTIDGLKERGKEKGFDIDNIYFSGFSSQGDGAMFEGTVNDFTLFMEGINPHVQKVIKNKGLDISWSVKHRGHYNHSGCREISFDAGNYPGYYISGKGWQGNFQYNMDMLESNIESAFEDYCAHIYSTLEKEYEYLTSREQIIESIESNEYEFTQDGKIF